MIGSINKRTVFRLVTVLWLCVIFAFSSRDATKSTEDSYRVGLLAGDVLVPEFEEWSESRRLEYAAAIDHPIRKLAHASEYALLGILLMGSLAGTVKKKEGCSWALGTAYAATDEFHQLFVPGRSGQLSDVCIDSAGVLAGVLLTLFFLRFFSKRKQDRRQKRPQAGGTSTENREQTEGKERANKE